MHKFFGNVKGELDFSWERLNFVYNCEARRSISQTKHNADKTATKQVLKKFPQRIETTQQIMAIKKKIKKTRDVVTDYLIAYIGEKAVAGTPHYDKVKKVWSVPILCYTARGIFLGGKIELDERLEIIYAPSKSEFTRVVEQQVKRLPTIVYANEEELEAKGFEVARLI